MCYTEGGTVLIAGRSGCGDTEGTQGGAIGAECLPSCLI